MLIDYKKWNEFVIGYQPVEFLQSFEWGEFQKRLKRQIFRLNGEWGQGLLIKYILPFNKNYLYCPRGPLLKNWDKKTFKLFLEEIKNLIKVEKSIFLRIEPPIISEFKLQDPDLCKVVDIQPSKTIILDLSKTEEELLTAMHYKTRYNIRLAKKQ